MFDRNLFLFSFFGRLMPFESLSVVYDSCEPRDCIVHGFLQALLKGFPDSSVGKESTCNVGDLGSIPGLRGSPGEGKDYAFQYSGLENSMGSQRVGHD